MKKTLTFLFALVALYSYAQVQVTFQVDMSSESVSADGVHIAGNLNGWSTDANKLLDSGSGIYEIALDLQPGTDYEFKFLNGNAWGTEEAAPLACTIGGNNRIFTCPTSDTTLPTMIFNDCASTVATQQVTFRVDMTGQSVSADGVHVAGNFNGWNPGATTMAPIGNDVYEVTVPVQSSIQVIQYKFINGNAWGGDELPGEGCANGMTNRPFTLLDAGDSVELPTAVFAGCANPVPTKLVVFTVNLAGETAASEGVHVAGSFQGWMPDATEMMDIGDNLYQTTANVQTTTMYIEYKYLNGNSWAGVETVPSACSYNENRYEIIELNSAEDTVLPTFEFGSCSAVVSNQEFQKELSMRAYPTVAYDFIQIEIDQQNIQSGTVVIVDMTGKVVFDQQIDESGNSADFQVNVSNWPNGNYVVQLRTATTSQSQKIIVQK